MFIVLKTRGEKPIFVRAALKIIGKITFCSEMAQLFAVSRAFSVEVAEYLAVPQF